MRSRFCGGRFPLILQLCLPRLPVGLCVVAVVTLFSCSLLLPQLRASGDSPAIAQSDLTLKEVLEKGLRARRPEEFAFIGRVVAMVNDGKLPLPLVQGTFNWARKKKPYPYPYFERGLKVRAAKIGIVVR